LIVAFCENLSLFVDHIILSPGKGVWSSNLRLYHFFKTDTDIFKLKNIFFAIAVILTGSNMNIKRPFCKLGRFVN